MLTAGNRLSNLMAFLSVKITSLILACYFGADYFMMKKLLHVL